MATAAGTEEEAAGLPQRQAEDRRICPDEQANWRDLNAQEEGRRTKLYLHTAKSRGVPGISSSRLSRLGLKLAIQELYSPSLVGGTRWCLSWLSNFSWILRCALLNSWKHSSNDEVKFLLLLLFLYTPFITALLPRTYKCWSICPCNFKPQSKVLWFYFLLNTHTLHSTILAIIFFYAYKKIKGLP